LATPSPRGRKRVSTWSERLSAPQSHSELEFFDLALDLIVIVDLDN
jgi:hypothetical protein